MDLPVPFSFDWDKANIDKNWDKHSVHYKEAEEIFSNNPLKLYKDKEHSEVEVRYTALGITDNKRRLYLVFTIRDNKIRVISVRDQSKKERELYGKK